MRLLWVLSYLVSFVAVAGDYGHQTGIEEVSSEESFVDQEHPSDVSGAATPESPWEIQRANLSLAREALEAEVAKGNLPKEAIEPLLNRMAPVLERISNGLDSSQDGQKDSNKLFESSPDLTIQKSSDGNSLQVIAQILGRASDSSEKSNQSNEDRKSSSQVRSNEKNETVTPVATRSVTSTSSTTNPVPMVFLLKTANNPPVSPLAQGKENASSQSLKEETLPQAKASTNRKIAVGFDFGTAGVSFNAKTIDPWVAPIGSREKKKSEIALTAMKNSSQEEASTLKQKIQKMISSLVQETNSTSAQRGIASLGSDVASEIPSIREFAKKGFALLKFPKLSVANGLHHVSSELIRERASYYESHANRMGIPFWLDLMLMLSALAVSFLFVWLVWRRRFWSRRVIRVVEQQSSTDSEFQD